VHGGRDFLNLGETTVAEVLQKQGYATGTWGKWHLGKSVGYMPWDRGFDKAYYAELYHHENNEGWMNGQFIQSEQWVSSLITDQALGFIRQNQHQPFFAYLSYLAPHEPWTAPDHYVQSYRDQGLSEALAQLYGMITEMDAEIGRLLTELDQLQLSDNTVVIFLSDNGPWWACSRNGKLSDQDWQNRNPTGLRGHKGQNWQNGIRVPLWIRFPDHYLAQDVDRLVDITDLYPTILDITGAALPEDQLPLDGRSIRPYLEGDLESLASRTTYFAKWHPLVDNNWAASYNPITPQNRGRIDFQSQSVGIRDERYKLLQNPPIEAADDPAPVDRLVLFDLQKDPLETTNIVTQLPEISEDMVIRLERWYQSILTDQGSFTSPQFSIGRGGATSSWVNLFGPSIIGGNTHNTAHYLTGLKEVGDFAQWNIDILTEGEYIIWLEQLDQSAAGLVVQLRGNPALLETTITDEDFVELGTMAFSEGPQTISLNVVGIENPGAEVKKWRRLWFVNNLLSEKWSAPPIPW